MNLHVTPRETQVIELLNAGLSQKEIAEILNCKTGTIDTHVKNLKAKTGLQKATELACAYTWKRYQLPLSDLPTFVRKRIAAALLVLSVLGMVICMDNMLRVVRTSGRSVRTVRTTRTRRNTRGKSIYFLTL